MFTNFKRTITRTLSNLQKTQKTVDRQAAETISITCVSLDEFMATKFPPRELLLAPWLPLQGLAMAYAPRGVGKTHFALGVGYAVATGGSYLKWNAPKARGVLIIDGEMPGNLLQLRLDDIIKAEGGKSGTPVRIINPDMQKGKMLDLSKHEYQDLLEEFLDGIDLIIVDNIATLCRSGRENDAEGWISVQQWLIEQRSKGRSVLLIHHSGKGGQQRGTSAREDVLDTVVSLQEPVDYDPSEGAVFEVRFEKNRGFFGADAEGFKASLKEGENGLQTWNIESLASSTYERVVGMLKQGYPYTEIAKSLGIDKSGVSRHAARAKQEGIV